MYVHTMNIFHGNKYWPKLIHKFCTQVFLSAIEGDKYMDCINIKPCNKVVYSLVNPSHSINTNNHTNDHEIARIVIQFENTDVIMNFFILGDGKLEREHAEGDVELHLPGSLCCHVLHPGGEHQV